MRWMAGLCLVALGAAFAGAAPRLAAAGGTNPEGFGIYSPVQPPSRHHPRLYRYDPRSWYYARPGYYPYYYSGYWVPRREMRYRYRYSYYGPRYRYYPAWGYGWCCRN
jgi:hypothetical protein